MKGALKMKAALELINHTKRVSVLDVTMRMISSVSDTYSIILDNKGASSMAN